MNKIHFVTGLMLLLNLQSPVCAQAPGWMLNKGQHSIEEINDSISRMMRDVGVSALSLAVIKNDEIVYFHGYGYKQMPDKDQVDTETLFQAGSLTKSFLVLVVYQLVDQGLLDLDKPMYQYLEYPQLDHDARYKRITPRMIMSHCSGIENWKSDNNPDTLEIVSNPGEKFVYSGEGYVYLSKIVALILHKPYTEYIEDLVIRPLGLRRSFSHFSPDGTYPQNYALGHGNFGKEFKKEKLIVPDPAGSMNMTAQDYAKLILAIFSRKYLSENRIRDILHPIIQLDSATPGYFYGPGFVLIFSNNDTIISHGGSTVGFRASMYYSTVSKNGFVYLTNSDRGEVLAKKMSEYTVGLNLDKTFKSDLYDQYPSDAIDCMKIYREKGPAAFLTAIDALEKKSNNKSLLRTLNELGYVYLEEDAAISRKLLEDDVKINSGSSLAVYLLGLADMRSGEYRLAYDNFIRARELHFDDESLDQYIKECKEKISKK